MIPTYGPDDVSDSRWVNFWRVCPYWKTYQCPCMWRIWAAKKVGGIWNVAWRKPAYPLASALIQDFRQNIHTPGSTHLIVRNSHQFRLLTLGSTYVRRTTSTSTYVCPIHPSKPSIHSCLPLITYLEHPQHSLCPLITLLIPYSSATHSSLSRLFYSSPSPTDRTHPAILHTLRATLTLLCRLAPRHVRIPPTLPSVSLQLYSSA